MPDDPNAQGGTEGGEGENANLRLLREKAERADKLEADNRDKDREIAVLKSGVDAESPLGKFFVDNYDGDFADVDALKAKATEMGIPFKAEAGASGEAQGGEGEQGGQESNGTEERSDLRDGAHAEGGQTEHPGKLAQNHMDQRLAEGAPWDEAAAQSINMLANAAMSGDQRALVQPGPQ